MGTTEYPIIAQSNLAAAPPGAGEGSFFEFYSVPDQAEADRLATADQQAHILYIAHLLPGETTDITYIFTISQSTYIYICFSTQEGNSVDVLSGAAYVGTRSWGGVEQGKVWRIVNPSSPTPTPTPTPPPTPGAGLPPPPTLESCVLPELSWNFIEVVRQAVLYVSCNISNLVLQVDWMISALAALIPQLLSLLVYVLSLKWLEDWVKRFFTELDIWLSNKFGIDPALPFFDELMKKTFGWFFSLLDSMADEDSKKRGW